MVKENIHAKELLGVETTLFIPLYGRANAHKWHQSFNDKDAQNAFKKFQYLTRGLNLKKSSQYGSVLRTILIDQHAKNYLTHFPKAIVISLGAGLCTRFKRLKSFPNRFIDIDMPNVIGLKKQLYSEEVDNYSSLAFDLADLNWVEEIKRAVTTNTPLLIIAEGILHYIPEQKLDHLFKKINSVIKEASIYSYLLRLLTNIFTGQKDTYQVAWASHRRSSDS